MGVASRPGPVLGSYASRSQTSSSAILHAAIMIRPLLSIGALVVLAAVAESASITDLFASYGKSTNSRGDDSYGKSTNFYGGDSYGKSNSYGGDSYGKSTNSYGEDSYNEQEHYKEDSYKKDGHYEKDDQYKDVYKQESREDEKYDHDNKMKKQVSYDRNYKHEPQYYEKAYYRPIYEVHEEEPMYRSKTVTPHKMYESSYRHKTKRSAGLVTREERVLARWEAVYGSRHAQSDCKCSAACLNVIPAFHRNLPAFSGL